MDLTDVADSTNVTKEGVASNRRWRRVVGALAVALTAMAALFVFRASVLSAAGGFLVHEDPADKAPDVSVFPERVARLVPRSTVLAHAAADDSRRVLVVQDRPGRLKRLGLIQTPGEILRDDLLEAGAPEASVELIPYGDVPLAYGLENLQGWLESHPTEEVSLVCVRLETRTCRAMADRVLTPAAARRVRVVALYPGDFTEDYWWKSRAGMKAFFEHWARWVHVEFIGAEPIPMETPPPREHVRRLVGDES